MKFSAEIKSYQIVNRAEGKIAKIVLEVPEKEIPKSYFVGGLVKGYGEFEVGDIKQDILE